MANSRGSANIRSYMYPGKHPLLPPKSPFPSVSSSYGDYVQIPTIGPNVKQNKTNHQRTSSESFLAEEQPSWLDDLLNEPETPVRRQGHRRSSSDSFAYLEAPSLYNAEYGTQDKYKNTIGTPFWGSREFDNYKGVQHPSPYTEASLKKQNNRVLNAVPRSSGLPSLKDNIVGHSLASLAAAKEASNIYSTNGSQRQDITDTSSHDPLASSEKNDNCYVKSETDTKRAKQQFAQRSRVRKLQYIAELERNVQALQAEGSEASAEVEFLNQQTLILSMENKALKQRLESLAQEKLIKYLEHEVLEREIGRLRVLYQQQQQQPQQRQQQQQPQQRQQQLQQKASSSHRRSGSRDLDSQFANLSLKNKDPNSNHGPMSGPLHS